MIYVVGDTHIPLDIKKLNTENFPEQRKLTKKDYVIICGDFGGVWDNGKQDLYWQNWLKERNFTTLFVDGNHESHQLLNGYKVEEWNGGKVHFINDSVIHLMRGQVFTINGYKFFTMGGGESIDKIFRVPGKTWWKEELPSEEEYAEAISNLDKHNWEVDYVISHTASMKIMKEMGFIKEDNSLNAFFDTLEKKLNYKQWIFGHFHEDRRIDKKHVVLYNEVAIEIE